MPNKGVVNQSSNSNVDGKFGDRLTKLGYGHLKQKLFKLGDGKVAEKLCRLGDEKLVEKLNKLVESRVLEKLEKLGDQKLAEKLSQIKSKKALEKSKSRNQSATKEVIPQTSTDVETDADKLFVRTGLSGKSRVSRYSNFSLDKITQFLEKQNEILLHKQNQEDMQKARRLSESDYNISLKKKPITPAQVKDSDDSSDDEVLDQDVVNILVESRERKGLKHKYQYVSRAEEPTSSDRHGDKHRPESKRIRELKHHKLKNKEKHGTRPSEEKVRDDSPKVRPDPPKPKIKKLKRRHIQPPAESLLGFSDILKLAQEKSKAPMKNPVLKPKAKVPERPLTQEEKDRLQRKQIRNNNEKFVEKSNKQEKSNSNLSRERDNANRMETSRVDKSDSSSFQRRNGQCKPDSTKEMQRKEESKLIERKQTADRPHMHKEKSKTSFVSSQERSKSSHSEKLTQEKTKMSSSSRSSVPSPHVKTKSSQSSIEKKPKTSFPEKSHHQVNTSSSSFREKMKSSTHNLNKKPRLSLPETSHNELNRLSSSEKSRTDKQRLSLPTKQPKQTLADKSSKDISRNVISSKHKQFSEKGNKNGFNSNQSLSGQKNYKSTMMSKNSGRNGSSSPVVYHGENENVLVCGPGTKSSRGRESPDPPPTNPFDRIYSQIKKNKPQAKKRKHNVIEDDSESERDEEMDDFIADSDEDYTEGLDISKCIRSIFGYDKRKFRYESDREIANMESNFKEQMKEEKRSARLGLQEDLEDIRQEEEELKRKQMKKKNK